MKRLMIVAFNICMLASCVAQQSRNELDPSAFERGISLENIQVLDVRTAGEFRSGHIIHALQADWNDKKEFADRTQYLDKSKPVYVYCLSGARSAAAADWFRKQGYANVFELKGGLMRWKSENKKLEGSSSAKQMSLEAYRSSINSAETVLVDFGAEWCPPCKKMEPVLEELFKEHGANYKLIKVDGGIDTDVMKSNSVTALPVFIIYKKGKEVWRKQGIVSKEELKKNL